MKIRLNIKNRGVKMGLLTLMVITIQFSISGGDVFAQDTYQVGTASVSTEPDGQLFSVAMSGYGYPPEGRFSLEWIEAGSDIEALPSNFISITGVEGMHGAFYAVDSAGNLWKGEADENGKISRIMNATNTENLYTNNKSNNPTFHWMKISTVQGQKFRAIAGTAKQLFALDQEGRLLQSKEAKKNHSSSHSGIQKADFKWEVIRPASDFRYLADLKGQLFAADGQQIARLDPSIANSSWQVIKKGADNTGITGIRSIAAVQSEARLLVINGHDSLWYVSPFKESVPWRQVGRFNGITYDVHLNAIGVLNNHLFAISKDHHLFVGRHSTDGNLCANTIAIKDAHKTIAIMGIDLTGFDHTLTEAVKDRVHRDRGIDKSAILINASHTHFPPTAQAYPAWGSFLKHPDTIYMNLLKNAMVRSIEKALDNMKPAKLYFGRGQTNIGLNRASENPDSPLDHTLDVLAVKDFAGKTKSVLFLTPCHAVFNNSGKEGYTLSANFPGVTRGLIKEKLGVPSIFIQGCAGDINPRSDNHVVTGTELAGNIFHILDSAMKPLKGDIGFSLHEINIPIKPFDRSWIDTFRKENENKPDDVEAVKNVRWSDLMLDRYKKDQVQNELPEYIQQINIGDWKLVGLSREVVNEYGPAIRKIWPDKTVSVAGYCNDVASYLPKDWHIKNQTYEGYGSFFWYGQCGIPPVDVFDIVINAIKAFK